MSDDMGIVYRLTAVSVAAAVLMVLPVMLSLRTLRKKEMGARILFGLCLMTILSGFLILFPYSIMYFASFTWPRWFVFSLSIAAREVLALLIVLHWLIYVDYIVYQSADHIKRHYLQAVSPIILVALLQLMEIVFQLIRGIEQSMFFNVFSWVVASCNFLINAFYVFRAFRIVRAYEKEAKPPLFLRLEVFIIPFLTGLFLTWLLPASFEEAGFGLGILLTWLTTLRRFKYLDEDVRFYTGDYLRLFLEHAGKRKYPGGSAVWFSCKEEGRELGNVLFEYKPDESLLIRLSRDSFVVVSMTAREKAVKLLQKHVLKSCEERMGGKRVGSKSVVRGNEETLSEFSQRVMGCIDTP